uniref:Uncharacterized protein n=1 Tax=Myotis myotis TaxID=51298 RepID=A0A7J7VYG9_MYOMY|nr:hypothetical protein mMyoMyo1_012227 [Myotis myotis]
MSASSLLFSFPSFPAHLASCLLTSLPLPNGAAHPPREAPWDGADGEGSGCPIRHTAWPGLEKYLGRAWSLSPNFAPAGLWVSFPGLPACCLPASLSASALEPCSPAFLGEGLWSPPPGADHHCWAWQTLPSWQGSWMDMPYAALQGQSGKGPFALAGLCPPLLTAASPPPQPHPWPWLQLISQLWSQPHRALQGVIWLPLVSERIIFSVDCPFL